LFWSGIRSTLFLEGRFVILKCCLACQEASKRHQRDVDLRLSLVVIA
jgi:hypothetical protein